MSLNPKNKSVEPLLNERTPVIAGYVASDQANGTTSYFGFIDREGNWYIQRQAVSGDNIEWRYAKGSGGYSDAWTGRAALSYNLYNIEFA